jgi:DHA2 family multidrug resistance protein
VSTAVLDGPGSVPKPTASAEPQINWPALLLGFGAMVIGQFMAILDIQIVSASLPQIQAGISASADEISRVQTAYLIPEVVMIPLSGYLSRIWGTQKLFLASCLGFTVMSVATGLSSSIDAMMVTRALQGFLGGAMIPTVFAIAFTAFPPKQRVTASVIMGLIVSMAPTVGPTLGGWLTDQLNWRWLFFINVPPGILVLFLVSRYGNFDKGDLSLAKGFDWAGLAIMAVFLVSFQFVLEEGAKNDWLKDDVILWLSVLAAVTFPAFIWRSLSYRQPIVELRAFKNRNFVMGICMTFVTGITLFGGTYLMPLFLGRIRHYSSAEIGTTMVISGVVMFFTGPIAGRLARKFDPRFVMCLGFLLAGWGMWLGHSITSQWGYWQFAAVQAFRSCGIMIAMISAQNVTMSTLEPHMIKNASGLVNLSRNVGGAFGLAVLTTTLTQQTAHHLSDMTQRVTASSLGAQNMMTGLAERMDELGVADPDGAGRKALFMMMQEQAQTLAFGDAFLFIAGAGLFAACCALLAKPSRPGAGPAVGGH